MSDVMMTYTACTYLGGELDVGTGEGILRVLVLTIYNLPS